VADIAIKSPGDGLPPYYLDQIVGHRLTRDVRADEAVTLDLLQPASGAGRSTARV
jgi:N-acetylneuraminate synthase/sialic acid synthase